jgi:hypothetical protein
MKPEGKMAAISLSPNILASDQLLGANFGELNVEKTEKSGTRKRG